MKKIIKYTPVFNNSVDIPMPSANRPIVLDSDGSVAPIVTAKPILHESIGEGDPIDSEPYDMSSILSIVPKTSGSYNPKFNRSLETARKALSRDDGKTYSDKKTFKAELKAAYERALKERGYSTDFADYIVAQDAHESNWGKSSLSKYYNFGGVKETRKGEGVQKDTTESFDGKTLEKVSANFRKFKDLDDYVNYKLDLLGNSNYNVFAYRPDQLYSRLVSAPMKYATDPDYLNKLNRLYKEYLAV